MRRQCPCLVFLLLISGYGCALFEPRALEKSLHDQLTAEKPRLGTADENPAVRRVIQVQVNQLVQPAADAERMTRVWKDLCEICLRDPGDRRRLNEKGFRVGVSGSPYPWSLSSLLSSAQDESQSEGRPTNSQMFFSASGNSGVPFAIFEGNESVIEVRRGTASEIPDDIHVPGLERIDPGETIRCILRVRHASSGNEWTQLRCMPELHFGTETVRLKVNRTGNDQLPIGQKVIPLFDQQFQVKLHPEDVMVLGYNSSSDWSIGRFFFEANSLTSPRQHVFVLKLDRIDVVEGRDSMHVDVKKIF